MLMPQQNDTKDSGLLTPGIRSEYQVGQQVTAKASPAIKTDWPLVNNEACLQPHAKAL